MVHVLLVVAVLITICKGPQQLQTQCPYYGRMADCLIKLQLWPARIVIRICYCDQHADALETQGFKLALQDIQDVTSLPITSLPLTWSWLATSNAYHHCVCFRHASILKMVTMNMVLIGCHDTSCTCAPCHVTNRNNVHAGDTHKLWTNR